MKFSLKEFFLKEYEDPTSSKHNDDDSKWAGPNSDKERMPHEEPQDGSQENSSEAWEESREDGPEKQADDSSMKGFFGGAATPKSSHSSSHKSSEKMSEGGKGSGRKKGSKNKPRDEFGGPPSKPEPHQGEIPDELPDEWVDDQPAMGQPPKSPEGEKGGEEGEIDWDSLDDDEFTDTLAGAKQGPEVKTQMAPPKMKDTISTSPAAPAKPYQTFDPDKYSGIDPSQIKDTDLWAGENENEQTWDEVRASAPKQAAELEKDFPAEELQGARFRKKAGLTDNGNGRIQMTTTSGKRFAYLGHRIGWSDMDDGNSPSGDF